MVRTSNGARVSGPFRRWLSANEGVGSGDSRAGREVEKEVSARILCGYLFHPELGAFKSMNGFHPHRVFLVEAAEKVVRFFFQGAPPRMKVRQQWSAYLALGSEADKTCSAISASEIVGKVGLDFGSGFFVLRMVLQSRIE